MRTDSLKRLAVLGLSSEQMSVVLDVLAVELAPMEAFRAGAAERTRRYHSHGAARITPSLRSEIYQRDGHICVYCGSEQDLTCDHVTPVSKGGQTTPENLVTACRPCNSRKKDRERKRDARSGDNARTTDRQRTESPPSRVIDNTLPSLTSGKKEEESKLPPITPPSKPAFIEPKGFSEFIEIYPPRAGGNDRRPAAKGFLAALRRAGSLEVLLDGTRRYRVHCDANGNTGTQYVLKPRKWLNDHGWENTYETTRTNHKHNSIASGFDLIDRAIEERFGSGEDDTTDIPRLLKIAS